MASRDSRVEQIDPAQYLDPPQVDVPGTLALARARGYREMVAMLEAAGPK
mgnify:CR=1 FL=1